MRKPKTIVIGSGLAGLSAALDLTRNGFEVLLLEAALYIGGRTASWNKDGMEVESGLHRVLKFLKSSNAMHQGLGSTVLTSQITE